MYPSGKKPCPQTLMGTLCSNPHRPPHLIIMNWCLIISGLIIVVLKVVGMTLFLLYCEYLSNLLPELHVALFLDSSQKARLHVQEKLPSLSTGAQLTTPFSLPRTHNGLGSSAHPGDVELT